MKPTYDELRTQLDAALAEMALWRNYCGETKDTGESIRMNALVTTLFCVIPEHPSKREYGMRTGCRLLAALLDSAPDAPAYRVEHKYMLASALYNTRANIKRPSGAHLRLAKMHARRVAQLLGLDDPFIRAYNQHPQLTAIAREQLRKICNV